MNTESIDMPGTLTPLFADPKIVTLCGSEGPKGDSILHWEHWLTLSGLLVFPSALLPAEASAEEMGLLLFMQQKKILASDALIVVCDDRGEINDDAMKMVIIALQAGKAVYTSVYCGGSVDSEHVMGGSIAQPLRCLDLDAPTHIYRLTWQDLQERNLRNRGPKRLAPPAATMVKSAASQTGGKNPSAGGGTGSAIRSLTELPTELPESSIVPNPRLQQQPLHSGKRE